MMSQDIALLNQISQQINSLSGMERRKFQIELLEYYEKYLSQPRNQEANRLLRYGYKAFSQNDEDGIIQEIFARIGVGKKIFVEFGVSNGLECNTLNLLFSGWRGLWMDGSPKNIGFIQSNFKPAIDKGSLKAVASFINADNINHLISTHTLDQEVDLLSIDIDRNDYWVWQAIDVISPRVVVIEYNALFHPPISIAVEYQADKTWDGSSYFGASLKAMEKLGSKKGYCLVGCCFSGANSFFVRSDLVAKHFCEPFTAENHYEPPRYYTWLPGGHPPSFGNFVEI